MTGWLLAILCFSVPFVAANEKVTPPPASLADELESYAPILAGQQLSYELQGQVTVSIDDQPQQVELRLARFGLNSFDLELTHADYAMSFRRRDDSTAMALPNHRVVFIGRGPIDSADQLTPEGIVARCLTSRTSLSSYPTMVFQPDAQTLSALLSTMLIAKYDASTRSGTVGSDVSF